MAVGGFGARRRTTSQARKISSATSARITPNGSPPGPGLPAISAAPAVAATTPAQDIRLTGSPSRQKQMAISAGMAPTSSAESVTLVWARASNCTMKAMP